MTINKTIVAGNQNLVDVALETMGSVAGLFLLAQANGMTISDAVEIGQEVQSNSESIIDIDIVNYFEGNGIRPNTGSDLVCVDNTGKSSHHIQAKTILHNAVEVGSNQNILDVALQHYGDIEGLITMAALNNLVFSDVLEPGQILQVGDEINNRALVDYFAGNGIPATGNKLIVEGHEQEQGIGIWAIGVDFVVS